MAAAKAWRTTAKIAWRDLKNSGARPWFIAAVLAAGLASVSGVHAVAVSARRALETDSRAWLAGDLCVDTDQPLNREQVRALDRLQTGGVQWTLRATLITTASAASADPAFVDVKAVDASRYPFYGAITLDPPQPLERALAPAGGVDQAAVSEEALDRFGLRVGDTIALAGHPFRISARIAGEPDRFANEVGLGLRSLISRAAFERAGFEAAPNPVKYRVLLKLAAESNLRSARRTLQQLFPGGNLRDFQSAQRNESEALETLISFLSVTAFLAVTLSALGAAIALREHAEQSLSTLAILRMLGARSAQIGGVFFFEAAAMMTGAIAAGIPLGYLLRVSLLAVASRYLILPGAAQWDRAGVIESAAAALVMIAPVLVQPALWIRRMRPAVVLRRAMWEGAAESGAAIPRALGHRSAWIAALISCAAFFALGQWILASWKSTLLLASAIGITGGVALALAAIALRILRWTLERAPVAWRARVPRLRYGLASVYAPGRRSATLIAALAVSVMLMIAIVESRGAVVRAVLKLIPSGRINLYVAGFRGGDFGDLLALLRSQAEGEPVEVTAQVRLNLRGVDAAADTVRAATTARGTPALEPLPVDDAIVAQSIPLRRDGSCADGFTLHTWDGVDEACVATTVARDLGARERKLAARDVRAQLLQASGGVNALRSDEWNYYYTQLFPAATGPELFPSGHRRQTMTVDFYLEQRANVDFPPGVAYLAECVSGLPPAGELTPLALTPDLARQLNAKPGSRLWFDSRSASFEARVSAIRDLPESERVWAPMEIDCSRLDPAMLIHEAGLHVRDDRMRAVEQAIRARYPAAAVVKKEEVEQAVRALTSDAIALARLVGWYAIACGFAVVLAAVAATRAARKSEVAILAALGASRGTVLKVYSIEFAAVGLLAAAVAGVLAWGISDAALRVIVHQPASLPESLIDAGALAGAALFAAAAALAGGWLPLWRALSRKPLETLRGD